MLQVFLRYGKIKSVKFLFHLVYKKLKIFLLIILLIDNKYAFKRNLKIMKNNKPGFTLIELLVVIAIIGLLSTLSIIALNSARARSRDARRISDVKQIQTALEMYYNLADEYPDAGTAENQLSTSTQPSIAYASTTFLTLWPQAPTPPDNPAGVITCNDANNPYVYAVDGNNLSYTLQYCLGGETGGVPSGVNIATPAGITSRAQ